MITEKNPNLVQYYAYHDSDPELQRKYKFMRIPISEAKQWNEKGYGIFQTINYFHLDRKKTSLVATNAWAVDMDEGTKEEQMKKIRSGLIPTMIIESKRGYQVWWRAKNGTDTNWKSIVWDRLVPFYGADKNAKDISRVLRVPGYYHMKDPADPFLIRKVEENAVEYLESDVIGFYPAHEKEKKELRALKKEARMAGSFWDRVFEMDCEYALTKLSGSEFVGHETYEFHQNSSGTKNILVNGKGTSCWVDKNGKIGSLSGGGPSIYQWLMWFHQNPRLVAQMLEKSFPELTQQSEQQGFSLLTNR